MKYRSEEESQNICILSGRIISQLTFTRKVELEGSKRDSVEQCEFIIKTVDGNKKSSVFRVYVDDEKNINKIKRYASVGSRIFFEAELESRKRTKEQRDRLGLELVTTDIHIKKITNIIDTLYDLYNKEERRIVRKSYELESENNSVIRLQDFENFYK